MNIHLLHWIDRVLVAALFLGVAMLMLAGPTAMACDDDPAHARQMKEQTRALEDQARAAREQNRLLKEQNKLLDRQRRNQR